MNLNVLAMRYKFAHKNSSLAIYLSGLPGPNTSATKLVPWDQNLWKESLIIMYSYYEGLSQILVPGDVPTLLLKYLVLADHLNI